MCGALSDNQQLYPGLTDENVIDFVSEKFSENLRSDSDLSKS